MVIYRCDLTRNELSYYLSCSVRVERINVLNILAKTPPVINKVRLPLDQVVKYEYKKGTTFGSRRKRYNEVIINNKVLRVCVAKNSNNSVIYTPRKSILKNNLNNSVNETPKSVKFNDTVIVKPISPRKLLDTSSSEDEGSLSPDICGILYDNSPIESYAKNSPVKNLGELKFSILQSNKKLNSSYVRQLNNNKMTTEETNPTENIQKDNITDDVEQKLAEMEGETEKVEKPPQKFQYLLVQEQTIPKRKRGRPRKNHGDPDPPFSPFGSPKKKPYIVPKKTVVSSLNQPKRKPGRPRKKYEFGFHDIAAGINSLSLPSDLWSAHVSSTSKRSQVCFTRIIQSVSDTVPLECDRSVKFIGGKTYFIKMNNRLVELVGAPKTVESLDDVQVLLNVVNDLNINDPILKYYVR